MLTQKGKQLEKLIDDFQFEASASSRIERLNFLLNYFTNSDEFTEYDKDFRSEMIFEITSLSHFLVKLQEEFEDLKHSIAVNN